MSCSTFDLKDRIKGNTSNSVDFTITLNDSAMDLTGVTATLEFRKEYKTGELVKTFIIGDGLTVTNALGGILTLDKFVCDFEQGFYYYDITLILANGDKKTYLNNGKMNVIL